MDGRSLTMLVRVMSGSSHRKSCNQVLRKSELTTHSRGIPHSIQALGGGTEFMLVFDDGNFSEDNTFLASEVFAHNPVGHD
jgi:hypothetical protein